MLPAEDKTPPNWVLPSSTLVDRTKSMIRKLVYPSYLKLISPFLQRRFDPENLFGADQWFWGHRGLEYELLRAHLERIVGIRNKSVLIAGCGTGRDIPSWLSYLPNQVLGVDYFSYAKAWKALRDRYSSSTTMTFVQGNLADVKQISNASVDIIGSDAVFEHLKNLPHVLQEFHRMLKDDGVIYATFGPLWRCWGGDHVSGYDGIRYGYNHLILSSSEYQQYLAGYGKFAHSEDDGRTWAEHGLFSYLRPSEYLSALETAGFCKLYLGMVIEPRAVRCLRHNPDIRQQLQEIEEQDLWIAGMTLIYRKASA